MMWTPRRTFSSRAAIALAAFAVATLAVACGGASAKSAPSAVASATPAAGRTRGPGNRTPSPDMLTSIAEGTPGFGNRTPSPDMLTSIAEGTPFGFGNRTPSAADQTAIAEGTPAQSLRGGFGGGGRGGGQSLTDAAVILAISEAELRSALQAPGASLESIAAAHGVDRPTLRQKLIDATRKRLSDQVAAGTITQAMADQNASQFESNIDSLIDRVGGGGAFATPTPSP